MTAHGGFKRVRERFSESRLVGALVVSLLIGLPTLGETAVEGVPCTSEPTDMIVKYGDVVNCSIDAVGDTDLFRFSGANGETVRVQVTRLSGGSPCFQVFAPDGAPIFGNRCQPTDYPLSQAGTHTILVSEFNNDEMGQYAVALERVAPPSGAARPIQYGQVINDEINGVGDLDLFSFNGQAGHTVRVQATRLGGGSPCFQVYAPNGAAIFGNRCQPTDYVLDQTGIHTILVSESDNNETVQYALTLECVSGACTNPTVADVEGCIELKGVPLANASVILFQPRTPLQRATTDARGCYVFNGLARGKTFDVIIQGPPVP